MRLQGDDEVQGMASSVSRSVCELGKPRTVEDT